MKLCLFIFLFSLSLNCLSQDERQFRELFSAELDKDIRKESTKKYHFVAHTPLYKIDLNGDNRKESIFYETKDGESWLHLLAYDEKRIKSFKLEPNGTGARIYKIRVRHLSRDTLSLIVFYYEGLTKYIEVNSTVRLYFLTIDKRDFKQMHFYKGPIFWEEKRTLQGHYHQRPNKLSFIDLNKNGVKELLIKQGNSASVYMYKGLGEWIHF
ncbi:hypothetical protein A9Q84_03905 [Halobacteriovorax marinus]|uniref:Uncharacterized protein n=1 Tax=Halobacteriovorax marinus TaxID=97084 RepID=A0A1Y5FAJ5_9BACT|nr:hypothetical protein A9Q84_03905 [Halobacteriovorax marinus]